jgi:ABC-type multidrug transport system ATPase subunit
MNSGAVIEVRGLGVAFGDGSELFSGLSFVIGGGEKVALTGPSGCGKTTLLRCLTGLVEPTAGEVIIDGVVLNEQTVWDLRGKIGSVPQEPDLGEGTVREFVEGPFGYRINASGVANLARVPDLMQELGLGLDLLDADVGELSGGEKQRVALVSALVLDRSILLLDEVVSALDGESAERVFGLLSGLHDVTVVGVVHDGARMPFATREIAVCGGQL